MFYVNVYYRKKKNKEWKNFGQLKLKQIPGINECLPLSVKKKNGSIISHLLKIVTIIHIPQSDEEANEKNKVVCSIYTIETGKKSSYLKALANDNNDVD